MTRHTFEYWETTAPPEEFWEEVEKQRKILQEDYDNGRLDGVHSIEINGIPHYIISSSSGSPDAMHWKPEE
jgi:hypothetical protein